MWLFSKHGFLSAVADRGRPGRVIVRARAAEDIAAFAAAAAAYGPRPAVSETPKADYRFRTTVPAIQWAAVAAAWAAAVDYPNFKDSVHGEPDRDAAYLACWRALSQFQQRRLEAGPPKKGRTNHVPRR